ncbi:MAG TPA: polymer-forming cytoskeletal protein [Polyangium sp.]|nr:polymer-forming cytoskeletal protein [Polyangium sp.]
MTTPSTIGRGTTIRGSIRGDGDLDLHGFVEGSVTVQGELLIGETALVKSDVSGRRIIVRGAVAGNVSATELVVLEPGARVVGDIGAPQIGIRPGALVRGNVSTGAPLPVRALAATAAAPAQAAPRGRAAPAPAAAPARPVAAPPARAAAPAARPAPAPARPAPAPRPPPARPAPAPAAPPPAPVAEPAAAASDEEPESAPAVNSGGPPPPVVPAVPKGAKAQIRRGKGAGK